MLPCYKATLILERKRDEANKMVDYFTLEKNNRSISYKFMTRTIQVKENEQMVTKVIQSDLCAFAETFKGYLIDIAGALRFKKLADNFENPQDENQQLFNATTTDDGYPYEYY
jgi:hypothetical protein